jgi:hypothetical protein
MRRVGIELENEETHVLRKQRGKKRAPFWPECTQPIRNDYTGIGIPGEEQCV